MKSIFILLYTFIALVGQSAEEVMKKSHLIYHYSKEDGKADVIMKLVTKHSTKTKEFTMVRKDLVEGGDQNYFIYFKKPSDIKKMTFLVEKHIDRPDDRMLYIPSIDLVKRIAASDKASRFVGSDFSYEDVSGRLWTEDTHEFLQDDILNGEQVFKIKSTPKEADYFSYKMSYISKKTFLPLKEEFFNASGRLFKRFTIEEVKEISAVPTATIRKMEDIEKEQYTEIIFQNILYDTGIKARYFKERYLKKPHRSLR